MPCAGRQLKENRMITVIGVRFRTAGKIYYFDPAGRKVKTGDHVIVETARGIEYGYVVLGKWMSPKWCRR